MIAYFDTSAIVPMLLGEVTRGRCQESWDRAEVACSTRLLYVEAASAIHRARRDGRIGDFEHRRALQLLDDLWGDIAVVELDHSLMSVGALAAGAEALRAYDAVHCAAGLIMAAEPGGVAVSGDRAMLDAWAANGAAVIDINA